MTYVKIESWKHISAIFSSVAQSKLLGSPTLLGLAARFKLFGQTARSSCSVQAARSKLLGPSWIGPSCLGLSPSVKLLGPRPSVQAPRSKSLGPRSSVQVPRSKSLGTACENTAMDRWVPRKRCSGDPWCLKTAGQALLQLTCGWLRRSAQLGSAMPTRLGSARLCEPRFVSPGLGSATMFCSTLRSM